MGVSHGSEGSQTQKDGIHIGTNVSSYIRTLSDIRRGCAPWAFSSFGLQDLQLDYNKG